MLPEVASANSGSCWWLKPDLPDSVLRNMRRLQSYRASRVDSNDCQDRASKVAPQEPVAGTGE
jgi:hypothetical protein